MSQTYECADCGLKFEGDPDWTDEDAMDELRTNFGPNAEKLELAVVCSDCYELLMRELTN